MLDFAMKVLTAPPGQTYLFSLGQAGYIIKSASGQLLGIDMYLSDSVERVEGHMGYKRMLPKILNPYDLEFTAVITTHPHRDHFDPDMIPAVMANGRTKLFASVECEVDLKRLEMTNDNVSYVKPGDSAEAGDFAIQFIHCDHGLGAPDAFGVIITVDGKRIAECGDTCLHMDWVSEYLSQGQLDILIGPINGMYGNMNEAEFAQLADALQPKLTIPCHYGMFASHMGSPGRFYDLMKEKYPGNRFLLMTQGERIEL